MYCNKTLKGFEGGEVYEGNLIEKECDILVLGAMEKVVRKSNAEKLQCKVSLFFIFLFRVVFLILNLSIFFWRPITLLPLNLYVSVY